MMNRPVPIAAAAPRTRLAAAPTRAGYGAVHAYPGGAAVYHPPAYPADPACHTPVAVPAGSMSIVKNGQTYYLNGNTWFLPAFRANGVHCTVVAAP